MTKHATVWEIIMIIMHLNIINLMIEGKKPSCSLELCNAHWIQPSTNILYI